MQPALMSMYLYKSDMPRASPNLWSATEYFLSLRARVTDEIGDFSHRRCPCGTIAHDTTLADLFSPDFELRLDELDNRCNWLEYFGDRKNDLINGNERDIDDCGINRFEDTRGAFKWGPIGAISRYP